MTASMVAEKREWFLAAGTKKVGPLTASRVVERLESGKVPARAKAWREGMSGWVDVREIPELSARDETAIPTVIEPPPRKAPLVARRARVEPGAPFQQRYRIDRDELWRAFAIGFEAPRVKLALGVFGAFVALVLAVAFGLWIHPILGMVIALGAAPASAVVTSVGLGALSFQTRRRIEDGATPSPLEALAFARRHALALVLAPACVSLLALAPPLLLGIKSAVSHIPTVGPPVAGLTFGLDLVLSAAMIFLAVAASLGSWLVPSIVAFEETSIAGTVRALLGVVRGSIVRIFLWPIKPSAALGALAFVLTALALVVAAVPAALNWKAIGAEVKLAPAARVAPPVAHEEPAEPFATPRPAVPMPRVAMPELSVGLFGIVAWTAVLLTVVLAVLVSTWNALTGFLYVACRPGNDDLPTRDDHIARSREASHVSA